MCMCVKSFLFLSWFCFFSLCSVVRYARKIVHVALRAKYGQIIFSYTPEPDLLTDNSNLEGTSLSRGLLLSMRKWGWRFLFCKQIFS